MEVMNIPGKKGECNIGTVFRETLEKHAVLCSNFLFLPWRERR